MVVSHTGGGEGLGVVLSPILEMATKAGGTMEAVSLSSMKNCLLPSLSWALVVSPYSMNQNTNPSSQNPVKICLAPAYLEWMVAYLEWMVVLGSPEDFLLFLALHSNLPRVGLG